MTHIYFFRVPEKLIEKHKSGQIGGEKTDSARADFAVSEVAYAVLRKLLAELFSVSSDSIEIERPINCKPYCKNLNAEFNISHSKNAVAIGISSSTIGVDLELIRAFPRRVADKYFSEAERLYISSSKETEEEGGEEEGERRFFELWTMRESFVKFTGAGIKGITRDLSFSDGVSLLPQMEYGSRLLNLRSYRQEVAQGKEESYICSVCSEEGELLEGVEILPEDFDLL
ncbi:MAG: 4'-phosphopantetheinyl transferase superfamily protein [Oscillospiraceae bacterium]|jgi:phosphopantetheinyl transferase|nr:4'-phosphopantetheinyl transferase superfamily protein [Oscillospiraceae bacterium]